MPIAALLACVASATCAAAADDVTVAHVQQVVRSDWLSAWCVSPNEKVFRDQALPQIPLARVVRLRLARREQEPVQLVLRSGRDVARVPADAPAGECEGAATLWSEGKEVFVDGKPVGAVHSVPQGKAHTELKPVPGTVELPKGRHTLRIVCRGIVGWIDPIQWVYLTPDMEVDPRRFEPSHRAGSIPIRPTAGPQPTAAD